jgi:hypothetical protein
MGHIAGHEDEVERAVPDDLVGDLDLAAAGIPGLRSKRHVGILARVVQVGFARLLLQW